MKRKPYKTPELAQVVTSRLRELQKMRRMASMLMLRLRREMRETNGEKELKHCIDEMARISQIQLKIIPVETELIRMLPPPPSTQTQRTPEDEAILAHAFRQWQEKGEPSGG